MEKPIRIAQIIGKWVGGGVEAVVMNYYRHIDRTKIQFDFICDSDSTNIPYEEIEKLGGKVILIPPYQKVFQYQKKLKKVFKEGNYKIVHSHINTLSVFPLRVAKKVGIPVRIAHSHSTTNKKEWKKNLLKQILRPFAKVYATDYFACSELAGRWLFGNKEFEKGNVYILNNAIDLDKYKYNKNARKGKRKELEIKDDTIVIGHIGRFVKQKNHDFLIDIFNEVHKKNKNTILLLAGQGPLEEEIKGKVKKLNLEQSVKFLGQRKDANELYQAFDIFLLPSLYEGLPVVAVEAQASGLLCVLSNAMTKETKVLDSTIFIGLEQSSKKWAANILNYCKNFKRQDTKTEITKKNFNIKIESKRLKKFYLNTDNKLGIFIADSNNAYPVPAVKGGAVQTLVNHIVENANLNEKINLEIISFYDSDAVNESKQYPNVKFKWIKVPRIIKLLDDFFYFVMNNIIKTKKSISYKKIFSLLWYIYISSKILKSNKYYKVILENNIPLAWIIKLSKYSGEYYYHLHNVPRTSAFCKDVFEKCNKFLCVSQYLANEISSNNSKIGKISSDNVCVLHNCISLEKFKKVSSERELKKIRKKYNIGNNNKIVLFVGRLSKEKGVDKVIEAIKRIDNDKIKLLIVGNVMHNSKIKDSYLQYLKKVTDELGDKVIFTGYVSQNELYKIYSISDVVVLPSTWQEPAGLTMIEALSCETPVITTISGGIPEYVSDCGVLLKINENLVDNIYDSIISILNKPNIVNSSKGLERIKSNFNSADYIDKLLKSIDY